MNRSRLIAALRPVLAGEQTPGSGSGREIPGLAYDSRKVRPGEVFFALPGNTTDGSLYAAQALEAGASMVVGQGEPRPEIAAGGAEYIRVREARKALALAAHAFYSDPSASLSLVGVTGTSGKTTTTYALESILMAAGHKVGVLGTNNYRFPGRTIPAPVTTPESLDLARMMAQMVEAGVDRAVMEVSSHALAQGRVRGCRFRAGCFTNLSRDHLDYHRDMEDYFQAKRRLFTEYAPEAGSALNLDDPHGRRLAEELGSKGLTYGLSPEAMVRAREAEITGLGIKAQIKTPAGDFRIDSPLMGGFNLMNFLAATALALLLETDLGAVEAGLNGLPVVPGRMEEVGRPFGRRVIVDYSHKVEALQRALEAVRELTPGRVIAVFGCGGDRDKGKRPMMGRAAAQTGDLVVLTSDNPRGEDPEAILAQIAAGAEEGGAEYFAPGAVPSANGHAHYTVIQDRRAAIALAIRAMDESDTVLIAGKGHEDYQIVGGEKLHLDDREEAVQVLRELTSGAGGERA